VAKLLKNIAIGAAVAGAAGYVAGVLSAPKSGKDSRKELKISAGNGFDDVEIQLKSIQNELRQLIGDAKGGSGDIGKLSQKKLDKLVEKANDSKDKVQDVVHAFKGGTANDKDLKKAVSDARHAVEHIKDFIKK
jgi:gas vesicle protein